MVGLHGNITATAVFSYLVVYTLFPLTSPGSPSVLAASDSASLPATAPRRPEDSHAMRRRTARQVAPRRSATRYLFERLEPRHVFSNSMGLEPPTGATLFDSSAPSLAPQSGTALTNFDLLPMVYAGPNASTPALANLQLNGEVLVNSASNLQVRWRMVSGPGSVTFGNANLVTSTAQFSVPGAYELELEANNGGVIAADRLLVNVTASNIINIDQAWLSARGPGTYHLDQSGKTYVLQTDVTTNGTAFAITAKDVTLDLNGHTITYNAAPATTIPNASFELGSNNLADGWDFSNAPNAARHAGTFLSNQVYDGDHSLKFDLPAGDQRVTSTSTVSLPANLTFSLSAMFRYAGTNPGVTGYVKLIGSDGSSYTTFWNQTNYRGIQFVEQVFKTGPTAATYQVQVGIKDGNLVDASKPAAFYIDDIKIQRTKTYGVVVGPAAWEPDRYPGVWKYGTATNATIKNGTIAQGNDGATWSHAIYLIDAGTSIDNMDVVINGANSSAIFARASNQKITNNTFTSNVETITSRDNFNGTVLYDVHGEISNNHITNGPHAGIWIRRHDNPPTRVFNNTIELRAKYTNAFGILAGPSSEIFNNTLNLGTGEFTARGIAAASGTAAKPTKIYNNTITVQELANNQEYGGQDIFGAYGIQVEQAQNVEIYGNDVTANGFQNRAFAFRINDQVSNVYVHDNVFRAISHSASAATLKFSDLSGDQLRFEDNTLITNGGIVGATSDATVTLRRTRIETLEIVPDPYVFDLEYSTNNSIHTTVHFVDTIFSTQEARNHFASGAVRGLPRFGGTPNNRGAIELQWTSNLVTKDASGHAATLIPIEIKNALGAVVASGTTDGNGQMTTLLTEFRIVGSDKTNYNAHVASATFATGLATKSLNATAESTVTIDETEATGTTLQTLTSQTESLAVQAPPNPATLEPSPNWRPLPNRLLASMQSADHETVSATATALATATDFAHAIFYLEEYHYQSNAMQPQRTKQQQTPDQHGFRLHRDLETSFEQTLSLHDGLLGDIQ